VDESSALKRLIEQLINLDSRQSVSLHNFTALYSTEEPDIVHCVLPTPHSYSVVSDIVQKVFTNGLYQM